MYGRMPLSNILVAAVLGVAAGFYIYKPLLEQYHRNQNKSKEILQTLEEPEEKKE